HINGVDDRKAPAGIQHGTTEYVFARMAELADIPGGSMRVRGVVNNLGGTLSPMLAASLCIGKAPVVIDVIGGLSNTASALFGGSVIAAKMPRDAVREMESAFYAAQAASMDVSHFEAREGEILAGHNLVAQEFAMAIDSIVSSGGFTPTMRLVDYLGSGDAAFDDMRVGASISKVSAEDLDDNPPRRSDVLVAFK
ncbi:MAG: hypothetical protein MJ025_07175, partial [Victivallaceae bacterium]|nr:hypothetical protein [Victivallaceae bacterium]